MPPPGRRPGTTELLPGLSLTKALALVLGVWVLCTLIMFHQHSFVAVSRFDYSDQVLSSLPYVPVKVSHLAQIDTNAAQSVAFVPIEDNPRRPYALVLVANYFGSSGLFALRLNARPNVQPLAVLQTECGHSWAVWQQAGRRWAAVANYCSKDQHKGVVVYELEPLTSSSAQSPDWGFKAAAAIAANGSSYVLHMRLPLVGPTTAESEGSGSGSGLASSSEEFGSRKSAAPQAGQRATWQDALAVAEYGSGHWVLYGLAESDDKGLVVSELQRTLLRGVAALALCSTAGDGGGGGVGDDDDGAAVFLVGLSYYDKGFTTRSTVYRCTWDLSLPPSLYLSRGVGRGISVLFVYLWR
ncbi:hypothetical protein PLESTM_001674400 [Pleodorina starrii]|nr:hypothetical protein PLESTM_001674400 [Pleodorina starrii]